MGYDAAACARARKCAVPEPQCHGLRIRAEVRLTSILGFPPIRELGARVAFCGDSLCAIRLHGGQAVRLRAYLCIDAVVRSARVKGRGISPSRWSPGFFWPDRWTRTWRLGSGRIRLG